MELNPTGLGKPAFRLFANDKEFTEAIADCLFSLQLTDGAGIESDLLEFVLVDDDYFNPIEVPESGAELRLFLGYEGYMREMGMFVTDEFEIAGYPQALVIRARAAVFDATAQGKTAMQTQKSRSWEKGTKLQSMLTTLAKEHGMEPAISTSMAGILLPHMDQKEESDLNFLIRVARKYDGVVKPAGGYLTVTKRGEAVSASGAELPRVTIRQNDVTAYRLTQQRREKATTVIAYYKTTKKAARTEVKVGNGDPVKRIGTNYPTKEMAVSAARAEYGRRLRGETTLNISVMGNPDLMAEMIATVEGIHKKIDGEWLVKTCTHRIGDGGYQTDLTLEQPNPEEEPETTIIEHKAPAIGSKETDDDDYPGGVITLPPGGDIPPPPETGTPIS